MTDSWMASPTDLVCPDLFQSNGTLLQYSCLENPMDGGARCSVMTSRGEEMGREAASRGK